MKSQYGTQPTSAAAGAAASKAAKAAAMAMVLDMVFPRCVLGICSGRVLARSRASVPIPKFANPRGDLWRELRNLRDTSNFMILVPLLNPKFATAFAAK